MSLGDNEMRGRSAAIGEILVDVVPKSPGRYFEGKEFEAHLGGAPFNYAVDFVHLGGEASGIGAVGKDPFGDMLISFLRREGVEVKGIVSKPLRTSLAFITLDEFGERTFFFYRKPFSISADTELLPEEVKEEEIERSDILHVSGMALSTPPLRDAVYYAMKVAKDLGKVVSFDLNFRSEVWEGEVMKEYEKAFLLSDLVSMSIEDISALFKGNPMEIARNLMERYEIEVVGVKMGRKGAMVISREKEEYLPSFDVNVVDTTGAGDAWVAAFNYYYFIKGESLEDSLRLANAAGALTCSRRGAVRGFSSSKEVEELASSGDFLPRGEGD